MTGGSLSLGYSTLTDSDLDALNKVTLGGSLEMGFSKQFSVQGDLGLSKFGYSDIDNLNFGLHAIFHVSDTTSLGAFAGRDDFDGGDLDYFGIELGHQSGPIGLETYISEADADGETGAVFGLAGNYAFSDTASLGLAYDKINVDGYGASTIALNGEFIATPGLGLTGEVGSADIEGLGSEVFMGIGVKVNFGAKRGATFTQRSVVDLLPGL
ncbi:MAG: hypothetical protein JXR75_12530 [Rhodobacteraceae bacterium]|nr:hypothetical protein [Paracoccaceae bacterium]